MELSGSQSTAPRDIERIASLPQLQPVRKIDSLVFNLNFRCDKRCSMCCVQATPSPRAADLPLATIAAVTRQIADAGIAVDAVGLSGGEPFLYGGAIGEPAGHTLAEVIDALCDASPHLIGIQTSGAGPMVRDFTGQLDAVFQTAALRGTPVEIESSYTSYQLPGIDDRMAITIEAVLSHQDHFMIYLTSDPDNAAQTLLGLRALLDRLGFAKLAPPPAPDGAAAGADDRYLFRFARGDKRVTARLALTLPVGRARRLSLRRPAAAAQFEDGCRWLRSTSLVVHPDGALGFCCMPTSLPASSSRYHLADGDLAMVLARHRAIADEVSRAFEARRGDPDRPSLCSLCNDALGNVGVEGAA